MNSPILITRHGHVYRPLNRDIRPGQVLVWDTKAGPRGEGGWVPRTLASNGASIYSNITVTVS